MSFLYSRYLLLGVFLVLCIFVVVGVASVYMCGLIIDWPRFCFGFAC